MIEPIGSITRSTVDRCAMIRYDETGKYLACQVLLFIIIIFRVKDLTINKSMKRKHQFFF